MKKIYPIFVSILVIAMIKIAYSQEKIDFNSEAFQVVNGEIVEHNGRTAFMGTGFLQDVNFKNGIIEYDMLVTGDRSYPGIFFRVQSRNDYEHFYIRPHRGGLYPDALQYTPCNNGIGAWQLFNGKGATASATFPENEWFHIRLEIKDYRASVYLNENSYPALEIFELNHGKSEGGITLNCPANGTAYFSNLSYTESEEINFSAPPVKDLPVGLIQDWEISKPYTTIDVEMDKTPEQQGLDDLQWLKVKAEDNGLINIGKFHGRQGRSPDFVYCRTTLVASKDTLLELKYGYSDALVLFLNGQPLCYGSSAYTQRDPSFLGIIGLHDGVYLPLKKGENELMLSVAESFGGWGFMCQEGSAVFFEKGITKSWETNKEFRTSESVLYDAERDVLYVTNFDQFNMGNPNVTQSISKLSLKGEILELNWATGLSNPLGMIIHKNFLFVAERGNVAKIDLETGNIVERVAVPESLFLNDIAIDKQGNIYASDSRRNTIWKISGNTVKEWLQGAEVLDPNTMYIHENKLLFGNSGDSWLKSVNLSDKSISKKARFPEGFIDGIRPDGKGNLLVSLWKGKIYRVTDDGEITLILHTENTGDYAADFEYVPNNKMLIIPTFYNNSVVGYNLGH